MMEMLTHTGCWQNSYPCVKVVTKLSTGLMGAS